MKEGMVVGCNRGSGRTPTACKSIKRLLTPLECVSVVLCREENQKVGKMAEIFHLRLPVV